MFAATFHVIKILTFKFLTFPGLKRYDLFTPINIIHSSKFLIMKNENRFRNSQNDNHGYNGNDKNSRYEQNNQVNDDDHNYRNSFKNDRRRSDNYNGDNDDRYNGYGSYSENRNREGREDYSNNFRRENRSYERPYDYDNRTDRNWWNKTKDEVSSWFGDDEAERRRSMDDMKDYNHRGKGPKNYKRSSERIKEEVSDKLSDNWMVDASEIEIEVNGTEVTLNGTVDSRTAKRQAEDTVESVSGVTHVQNNLRVNANTSGQNKMEDKGSATSNAANSTYSNETRKRDIANHN
jgi:osmotically-inducible protein OsmY